MKTYEYLTKGGALIVDGPGCHYEGCPQEGTRGVIRFFRDGSYEIIIPYCEAHKEPDINEIWKAIKLSPALQSWLCGGVK